MSKKLGRSIEELLIETLIPEKDQPYQIPDNWVWTKLGVLGKYHNGRAFKPTEWASKGRPIIRIQDLTGSNKGEPNYFYGPVADKHEVENGDFLISWSATLGAFIWEGGDAVLNQHIFKVETYIDKKFHYFLTKNILNILYMNTHGSGMVHVTKKSFDSTSVPLPPLNEQKRIADKVERLLDKINQAKQLIKEAKETFELRRAAILGKAFRGELTEKWREDNPNKESAEVLYKRLVHYTKYHNYDFNESFIEGKLIRAKNNNKWIVTKLGEIAIISMGQSPAGKTYNNKGIGTPLINGPVEFGPSPFSETRKIKWTTAPTKVCEKGDLILCVRGSTTGRMNIAGFKGCIGRGVAAVHIPLIQKFINYKIHSIQNDIYELGTGSTFPNISKNRIENLLIEIAPIEEIEEIVSRLDNLLLKEDKALKKLKEMEQELNLINQGVLYKAFRGELGTNDPFDVKAENLLKDILQD